MLSKAQFIEKCLKERVGSQVIADAMEGGPRGMKAREKFVKAMCQCQKDYCNEAAVEALVETVNSGKIDSGTLLKIIEAHEKCSPGECEL